MSQEHGPYQSSKIEQPYGYARNHAADDHDRLNGQEELLHRPMMHVSQAHGHLGRIVFKTGALQIVRERERSGIYPEG